MWCVPLIFLQSSPGILGQFKDDNAVGKLFRSRYIQKEKMTGHDGDGIVYELAERALDESFQRRYEEFMSKVSLLCVPQPLNGYSF